MVVPCVRATEATLVDVTRLIDVFEDKVINVIVKLCWQLEERALLWFAHRPLQRELLRSHNCD